MKQRGNAVVIILILITLGIFFAPIPSIIKEDFLCQPCPPNTEPSKCPRCPKKGDIEWRPSIFKRVVSRLSKPGGLMEIINPPPSPSSVVPENPSGSPDPTANWKTYKSSFWNIELKYPSEIKFANTKVLEQEVLRFENDNGYMQIENACAIGAQGNEEDTVSLLGSVFSRYRLPKSGEFNQLSLHTNELKATDKRCMYIIFGLKPDFEKSEKLLFDQILSTFKFLDSSEGESVEFLN